MPYQKFNESLTKSFDKLRTNGNQLISLEVSLSNHVRNQFIQIILNHYDTLPNAVVFARKWLFGLSHLALISALAISGCTRKDMVEQGKQTSQEQGSSITKPMNKEVGEASWYGPGLQGKETANGETFDQKELTAAHPTLPMGTKAKVTNLENGKQVDVRINDRGPFSGDRVIDLSKAAAKKLDMQEDGTTQVKIETKSPKKKPTILRPNK